MKKLALSLCVVLSVAGCTGAHNRENDNIFAEAIRGC